jgi:hypothetical protein
MDAQRSEYVPTVRPTVRASLCQDLCAVLLNVGAEVHVAGKKLQAGCARMVLKPDLGWEFLRVQPCSCWLAWILHLVPLSQRTHASAPPFPALPSCNIAILHSSSNSEQSSLTASRAYTASWQNVEAHSAHKGTEYLVIIHIHHKHSRLNHCQPTTVMAPPTTRTLPCWP